MSPFVALLLLAAAVSVQGAVILDEVEVERSWLAFKEKFGKVYRSDDEEQYRRVLFERKLQDIFNHKLKYDRGEVTWYKGVNQFSDWDDVDHRSIACVYKSREGDPGKNVVRFNDTTLLYRGLGSPPESINWVTKGKVHGYIFDQTYGACGGCYAIAATAVIESAVAIKHATTPSGLAEQQLIDCGYKYGNNGCQGGHPCGCYDEVIAEGGIVGSSDYPFRKAKYQGHKHKCEFDAKKVKAQVTKYYEGNKLANPEEALINNVGLVGPTTVSICENKNFKDYDGGVFADTNCNKECKKHDLVTHTMTAIGYDKDNWIIKNSWGTTWGENGHVRIKRVKTGDKQTICYLGLDQSYPTVK